MAKEHVDALISARDRLVESRRQLAVALGRPFRRADTETWRKEMIEVQTTIRAIDDALLDETEPTTDRLKGRRGALYRLSALRRSSSGSVAKFAAIRRASSRVSSLAADRLPGSSSKYTYAIACPVPSRTIKQALFASSSVQGGGMRPGRGVEISQS